LAHAGQTEAAIELYLGAGDTAAAVRLVLGHAPELAAQGRLQTLAGWIGALPAGPEAASPWLGYWLGVCQLGVDPPAARAQLEAAFKSFGAACDTLGQTVAAAGIIETYNFELADFTPFDHWIPVLHALLDQQPAFPDPALELGVLAAIIGALVMRKPDRLLLAPRVPRARVLLDLTSDINTRLAGASRLLQYCVFLDDVTLGEQLIAYVRPQLSESRLTAVNLCTWQHMESMFHQFTRYDARKANASMDDALDTMDRNGLLAFAGLLRARAAMLRLEASNLQGAEEQLARAAPLPGGPRFDLGWGDGMQSWLSLLRGEYRTAVQYAQRLVDASAASGAFHPHGMALLVQANALAAAGERARASECLRQVAHSFMEEVPQGRVTARLIKADLQLAVDDTASVLALLRDAFADAREHRLFNTLQWLAPQMSRLCAFALQHGIEPDYVTALIRLRGLVAPTADLRAWPWPIKVHTLGCFEILKDDQPLYFEGKTQRKPMALLRALIALGGSDVPENKLIDIVWDGSLEGDQQKAFDVTLHRLRKLLGHDRAIQVSDRRVTLNREIVWVDLWALEHQLAGAVPVAHATLPDPVQLERSAPAILNLYRGHFLDGEADAPWLLPVRNRLNGRFQRFVMRLGDHWEAAGDWGRAAELYERAVELDALAETFYCRQMVCLREQGRRAEAIDVFRRCRQMLSVTLGVKPTEATEAVYRGLIGS
jgi:DNA-binding SARP family transcriptional activator